MPALATPLPPEEGLDEMIDVDFGDEMYMGLTP
eukprot:CAMPEP_0119534482 /NCGR_PEP_ID=MMETSP1344-20130328/47699_1 /TAXON_ID=236787 /ORGANISM="Florenciella parvula, Strain CCMP2471" /LENGTH=32 /DNA_ID= /DNA_START= /DNA_END= /DNA_ORIENTATION=